MVLVLVILNRSKNKDEFTKEKRNESGLANTDVYNTANKLLMDMTQQQKMSDNRMRVSNNASDVNRTLQHKEMLETMKGSDGEREEL